MRNSTSGSTPKRQTAQDEDVSNNSERTSAKKLKQARLPFKVIAAVTTPDGSKSTNLCLAEQDSDAINKSVFTDCRKRKLSCNTDGVINVDIKAEDNLNQKNVELLAGTSKKKKLSAISNNIVVSEFISLLEDDTDGEESAEKGANNSIADGVEDELDLNLKESKAPIKDKRTPKTSSAKKDRSGSATKLQIKLPLSGGKKKRRKSSLQLLQETSSATESSVKTKSELSSDDIDDNVGRNPQKRKKLNYEFDESENFDTKCNIVQEEKPEVIDLGAEHEQKKSMEILTKKVKPESIDIPFERCKEKGAVSKAKQLKNEDNLTPTFAKSSKYSKQFAENFDTENIQLSEQSDKDETQENCNEDNISENEADDETDHLGVKSTNMSLDNNGHSKSQLNDNANSLKNEKYSSSLSKTLTSKQLKLKDQRRMAREVKERKIQEEKMKKQQEKEEKEMTKKREREEKEEQKRIEREVKEEQKRKEREEKERKRLAEIEAKNEEKRKKNEAKEEELRKREEERKRKEQEKEEAELKKRKAAQAFTKFFVAKTPNNAAPKSEEDSNTGDGSKLLAFRPFQIKGDMKLAPICRKNLTTEEKNCLDEIVGYNNNTSKVELEDDENKKYKYFPKVQLYLSELSSGKILPGKWRRPSTDSKCDIIVLEDELERVGQEIVEDTPAYVREQMRVKFYKFHDNRRPPYYGTWRKKSAVVTPRRPFAHDVKYFDYDVDSDDEWEEEEPGESLEDGSDEDKDKESEDDEYEVDNEWFVPHGHLSDEELQNEDDLGIGDDNTREAQKVKLQLLQQEFAQEMKKKTEKIKPRLIGCIWADINGNQPTECPKILWETLQKKAMLFTDLPLVEEPEVDRSIEPSSPSGATNSNTEKVTEKPRPISLSDDMIKDLTRLIHGNNRAKNFLINEYIAYVEKTEESVKNGGLRKPLKSVVRDKIDEIAEWQAVDAAASSVQSMEQTIDETIDKKKKKVKRRLCWVVKQDMLDKMDLSSLDLKNSWKYTLQPKSVKADNIKTREAAAKLARESISTSPEESEQCEISLKPKLSNNLTSKGMITKLRKISSIDNSSIETKTKEKKRVPLLMSVPRGQHIPSSTKNNLISQFLQQKSKDSAKSLSTSRKNGMTTSIVEDDDVLILD